MKRLLTSVLALSLLAGTAAWADPHGGKHGDNGRYDDHDRYEQGRHDDWREQGRHDNGNHYGQYKHRWARGERLPSSYYSNRGYYVDYRVYHLRQPPRGYQWVRVDNNYALVALTTGLIASIIIASH
jgi:Ni/Co efflux regulator RcnB